MPSVAVYVALLLTSILPRVEDPLPDEIGFGVLLEGAGFGGILASVLHSRSSPVDRDEVIHEWGRFGFIIGAVFYLSSLFVQVGFS
jgi:hypothetical protein